MKSMRERTKEHFPTVLLTLLSIVQALALELLWAHLGTAPYLFELTWLAVLYWAEILATLIGIVLIWLVYASNVMRFRWVPATSDSIFPFIIGIVEFVMIDTLGPDTIGTWLVLMAAVFATMTWIAHTTMKRAREDSDNADFFVGRTPAVLADFYPQIFSVALLLAMGLYLEINPQAIGFAAFAVAAILLVLVWQFNSWATFWKQTVAEE